MSPFRWFPASSKGREGHPTPKKDSRWVEKGQLQTLENLGGFASLLNIQTVVDWEANALNSSPVSVIHLLCDLKLMTVPPHMTVVLM